MYQQGSTARGRSPSQALVPVASKHNHNQKQGPARLTTDVAVAMIWYLVFTGMFLLYQLDVALYAVIALFAKVWEILYPEPGNPWHSRWRAPEFVEPLECDNRGFKLLKGAAVATDSKKYSNPAAKTQLGAAGWQISTQARVSTSSLNSSAFTASSAAGSSSGSATAGSDCNSSAASGSQPGTPRASTAVPARMTLQQLFAQLPSHTPLATVYSEQLPSSPEAATAPHLSAKGLRLRAGGSDDGGTGVSCCQDHVGYDIQASASAATDEGVRSLEYPQWAAAADIEPEKQMPNQQQLTDVPPPSSAVAQPGKTCLLPASLVSQYEYFPMVLVQLPMYNEEAHCEVVIERACNILWPKDRIIVQACDDSTRDDVKQRIDAKVLEMRQRGHNCLVTRRAVNKGFKAGNMINGMTFLNEIPWEYVAVFDADFEMPPDFLYQTIWHMQHDSKLAFVQTRWSFTNTYDNMLCWAQAVSLNFHFAVEQRSRSFLRTFFGFNGTAGVWRRTAMEQAGGWNMESTVEDMDLSLRAYLNGWHFKYLHWVSCPNELPPTMSAYKTQQYRWNSGPMVVVKQMVSRIWSTDKVTLADRISCSYFFFRFIYSAFLTVICLVCPAIVIWLDRWQWSWAPMMFLVAGNATILSYIWFAGLLFWPYFLIQTGVGYFRVYAMANGLIGSKKSGTWKVTKKFGKGGLANRVYHKPYLLELLLSIVFLGYAFAAVWYGVYVLGSFCWIMSWTFLMISFGDYLF